MHRRFACLVALAAVATGCSHNIRIERTRPAEFNLPTTQTVAVEVQPDGTPPTTNNVVEAAISVTQGQILNKWVAMQPVRQELESALRRGGYQLVDKSQAAVIIWVKPTKWAYELSKDPKQGRSGSGRIDVHLEVIDAKASGAQPLYSSNYWATSTASKVGELEAMGKASQRFANRFLQDLTPQRYSQVVEMDDSDDALEAGIDLCEDGQFDAAYQFFSDATVRNPNSAPALYNLAVLTESRGEYDAAENLLVKATQLNPKQLYYEGLSRVRNAREEAQALQAQTQQ